MQLKLFIAHLKPFAKCNHIVSEMDCLDQPQLFSSWYVVSYKFLSVKLGHSVAYGRHRLRVDVWIHRLYRHVHIVLLRTLTDGTESSNAQFWYVSGGVFSKRSPIYRALTCKIVSDIESSQPFEINTNLWTCLRVALVDLLCAGSQVDWWLSLRATPKFLWQFLLYDWDTFSRSPDLSPIFFCFKHQYFWNKHQTPQTQNNFPWTAQPKIGDNLQKSSEILTP